jgi:AraC-like DNA-binding protein
MQRSRTIEDFVQRPLGRYSVGATHLVWCHSASLCGTVHWGTPNAAHALELSRRLEVVHHPSLAAGFDAFMDARAMESFDLPAFTVLSEYVKSQLAFWGERIRRHAIVAPRGLTGIHVAGLLPLLGPSYPLRFFATLEEAQAWLERPELAGVLDEVGRITSEVHGMEPLLRALRDHLEQNLIDASLESAAQALGLSARSLQRELKRLETQFTTELMQARLRVACQMLVHSDEKIDAIARLVGCSSSSRLSALMRVHVSETPAEYRERRRR